MPSLGKNKGQREKQNGRGVKMEKKGWAWLKNPNDKRML